MLTSAIAQPLVQVQPRVDHYTIRSPKTEADYVKPFNAIYQHARSSARQVNDQKTKGCHVSTILSPVRCPFDMAESVNPSARSSASATYRGARQMPGSFSSRTVVVSRVSSAADVGGEPAGSRSTAAVVRVGDSVSLPPASRPPATSNQSSLQCQRRRCRPVDGATSQPQ